ncbi:MAG: hypothetical protein PHS49_01195 [Candidatus Gracilibacteria bacterium]|nr:hypothetical protein [Candidatus Gracilibacteria bacterium]
MEKNLDIRQNTLKNKIVETLSYHDNFDIKDINDYINKYKKEDEFLPLLKCFYIASIDNGKGYIIAYKYKSQENISKFGESFFKYKSVNNFTIDNKTKSEINSKLNIGCIDDFFNKYYLNN